MHLPDVILKVNIFLEWSLSKFSQISVVVQGNGLTLEYHSRRTFFEKENVSVTIRFHESAGWYGKETRRPVDKTQFMTALANVEAFLIRAMYHQSQLQARY